MFKQKRNPFIAISFASFFILVAVFSSLQAQDLSDYSIEDLGNVPVVESSKQSERLFDAPASAFIFDEDAIEYLPVDSVPEMLRYAPGVNMTRATNGIWGLGIRGMSSRFLGRVLFTVDEQNIYSTLYAGLFGSQHDLFMPDISSVEVVYGPGGSLWGTNAVNGMVNVIMKSPFETEDTIALAQFGSLNKNVGVRSGWSIGENTSARVYVKYGHRESGDLSVFDDEWKTTRTGFQIDHLMSSRDLFTLSSELYSSELGWAQIHGDQQTGEVGILEKLEKQSGVNLQGKWTHQEDANNGFTVRSWVGYTDMDSGYVEFELGIAGSELRARYSPTEKDQFVFTLGGTLENYNLKDTVYSVFHDNYEDRSFTVHAGTEYTRELLADKIELSLGFNYQYESHSSSSVSLPSIRLLYSPDEKTRLWASISRAARPIVAGMNDVREILYSVVQIDPVSIPTPYGTFEIDKQFIYGTSEQNFEPEKLDAFELGVRRQINDRFSVRANLYHYSYSNVMGGRIQNTTPILNVPEPYFKSYYELINVADGNSDGIELSTEFELSSLTKMVVSYSIMKDDFDPIISSDDLITQVLIDRSTELISNSDPSQLFSTWWTQQWSPTFRTDTGLRYASGYSSYNGEKKPIWQADFKASWDPTEFLRISLVGRNLLQPYTNESPLRDMLSIPTEQPREWYLEIRYQF